MAASPTKRKPIDPNKRFNNGHILLTAPKSDFLREIYTKETESRDKFSNNCHLLKKPRNPCVGDLTSREDADYLIPFSTTLHNTLEIENMEEKLRESTTMQAKLPVGKFLTDVGKVEALRKRREIIQAEMEQINKVMQYKQICIALGAGEKACRTLHPALQQTTKYSNTNMK